MTQQSFKDYILDRHCVLSIDDCMYLMQDSHFVREMIKVDRDIYEIIFDDMSKIRFTTKTEAARAVNAGETEILNSKLFSKF